MDQDKLIERARYDARAQSQMVGSAMIAEVSLGSKTMAVYLQKPYICYEQKISKLIQPSHRVLELGAGTGLHTCALLQTGAQVTASDISPNSLSLLKLKFKSFSGNLKTEVADMENLPFDDSSFDVIASAGCLSYGDCDLVMNEIYRVLKPGGYFICVDSLNHNPVYRLNRTINYLRGRRTASTIMRMPTIPLIESYRRKFGRVELQFFGAFTWLSPLIAKFIGEASTAELSDKIDRLLKVKMSAFKFVMVAQKTGFEAAEILS